MNAQVCLPDTVLWRLGPSDNASKKRAEWRKNCLFIVFLVIEEKQVLV